MLGTESGFKISKISLYQLLHFKDFQGRKTLSNSSWMKQENESADFCRIPHYSTQFLLIWKNDSSLISYAFNKSDKDSINWIKKFKYGNSCEIHTYFNQFVLIPKTLNSAIFKLFIVFLPNVPEVYQKYRDFLNFKDIRQKIRELIKKREFDNHRRIHPYSSQFVSISQK